MEITIKNKISKRFDNHNCQSFVTLSFRLYLVVSVVYMLTSFGYAETLSDNIDPTDMLDSSLLPGSQDANTLNIKDSFRIQQPDIRIVEPPSDRSLTEIDNSAAVNFTAVFDKKTSDLLIATNPATGPSRRLWQAGISISDSNESSQNKNELQLIIQQVSSVEFKKPALPLKPLIDVGKAEPNEVSDAEISGQQNEKQMLNGRITNQTLKIFEQLSQQPQQIKYPFELAEILFRSGRIKEAAKCYREALTRKTADSNDLSKNKEWMLFQLGNCLQKDAPSEAIQMFKQLIVEYPNSPWADSAKAKCKLIDWYMQDKPNTLIKEKKS
jgi:hypothetical protein